jgi:hypothetical protein
MRRSWGPHGQFQRLIKCRCLVNLYHNRVLTNLISIFDSGFGHIWTRAVEGQCQRELVICHSLTEAPEDLAASACQALMESVDY